MSVSPTAASTATAYKRFVVGHIFDDLSGFRIFYKRSKRNLNDKIRSGFSVEFCAGTVCSVFCNKFTLVSESEQGIAALVNLKYDIPPFYYLTALF